MSDKRGRGRGISGHGGRAWLSTTSLVLAAFLAGACLHDGHSDYLPTAADAATRADAGIVDAASGPDAEIIDSTILLSDQAYPVSLAASSTHLYWLNRGTRDMLGNLSTGEIKRMSLAHGTVETIATGLDHARDLALDETHVYWVQSSDQTAIADGSIWRATNDGSSQPAALITQAKIPKFLQAANGRLYWTEIDPNEVLSCASDGSDVTSVAQADGYAGALLVTEEHFFWAVGTLLTVAPLVEPSSTEVLYDTGSEGVLGLHRSGNDLFWVSEIGFPTMVRRLDLTTHSTVTLALEQDGLASSGLTLTESSVIFAFGVDNNVSALRRAPLEPSTSLELWRGSHVAALVVASDRLFWLETGDDESPTGSLHVLSL